MNQFDDQLASLKTGQSTAPVSHRLGFESRQPEFFQAFFSERHQAAYLTVMILSAFTWKYIYCYFNKLEIQVASPLNSKI